MDVTKSTMLFSRGVVLVEGIAEALVLPKLAELVLQKYNASHQQTEHLASTLDEMGISVINISGINFAHFMQLFGNFNGSSGPAIPIYCSGLTDRDPDTDIYPKKEENPASNNPICDYLDEINGNAWMRLYVSPLKTFEYDLAIYNPVVLAKTMKELWPTDTGEVCRELTKIIDKNNEYVDLIDLSNDAQYIYKHIESPEIGKGIFAQMRHAVGDVYLLQACACESHGIDVRQSRGKHDGAQLGTVLEHALANDIFLSLEALVIGHAALHNPGFRQIQRLDVAVHNQLA